MPSGKGLLWAAPLFKASSSSRMRQKCSSALTLPFVDRFTPFRSHALPRSQALFKTILCKPCKTLAMQEPILSFFNPSQLRSNLISSFGYLSSPKPRSGLTGLRWRIAAKKVHWHGHEILRRLRSFRKLRQPRGLKRFERRQFSLGIDWESDLVVMGGCFHG